MWRKVFGIASSLKFKVIGEASRDSSRSVFLNMGRSKFLGGNYEIANWNNYLNYFCALYYFMLWKQTKDQNQKCFYLKVAKRAIFVLKCCQFCSNLCVDHSFKISLCLLNSCKNFKVIPFPQNVDIYWDMDKKCFSKLSKIRYFY